MLLTESPYQALLVTDGFQALKMVHELKPSLFLVDYQLPGMDGIALYDHLHAITDLADIPAIIISANLPTRSLQERHLTGIAKPFRSRPTAPHDCTTPRVDQHGGHVPKADEQLHHALKPKRGGKYIVAAEIRKLSRNWLEPRHQRLALPGCPAVLVPSSSTCYNGLVEKPCDFESTAGRQPVVLATWDICPQNRGVAPV